MPGWLRLHKELELGYFFLEHSLCYPINPSFLRNFSERLWKPSFPD